MTRSEQAEKHALMALRRFEDCPDERSLVGLRQAYFSCRCEGSDPDFWVVAGGGPRSPLYIAERRVGADGWTTQTDRA
jgi:hypothetical protein